MLGLLFEFNFAIYDDVVVACILVLLRGGWVATWGVVSGDCADCRVGELGVIKDCEC